MLQAGHKVAEDTDWSEYLARFDAIDPSDTYGPAEWSGGVANLGEALQVARKGWPEGMEWARDVAMPALSAATSTRVAGEAWTYDVTGAAYDVGEYLSGVPECWLACQTSETRPVISILVNIAVSAGVPADAIRRRGAAVTALALHLQASGYVVELWSTWGVDVYDVRKGACWHRVRLSDGNGGPLDVDRVLFALAHPAAGRQLAHFMVSHGQPINNPPWTADLYLPCMSLGAADWKDAESVTRWVETTYQTLTDRKGD